MNPSGKPMNVRKYRWSKAYESAEEELIELLAAKNITAERQAIEEDGSLAAQSYPNDTRMWCAEGAMILNINGSRISMQPGDTLDIPARTTYDALAGFTGCAFYLSAAADPR